jgi:hypothetical protein
VVLTVSLEFQYPFTLRWMPSKRSIAIPSFADIPASA